jgi:hypothetical protein
VDCVRSRGPTATPAWSWAPGTDSVSARAGIQSHRGAAGPGLSREQPADAGRHDAAWDNAESGSVGHPPKSSRRCAGAQLGSRTRLGWRRPSDLRSSAAPPGWSDPADPDARGTVPIAALEAGRSPRSLDGRRGCADRPRRRVVSGGRAYEPVGGAGASGRRDSAEARTQTGPRLATGPCLVAGAGFEPATFRL